MELRSSWASLDKFVFDAGFVTVVDYQRRLESVIPDCQPKLRPGPSSPQLILVHQTTPITGLETCILSGVLAAARGRRPLRENAFFKV